MIFLLTARSCWWKTSTSCSASERSGHCRCRAGQAAGWETWRVTTQAGPPTDNRSFTPTAATCSCPGSRQRIAEAGEPARGGLLASLVGRRQSAALYGDRCQHQFDGALAGLRRWNSTPPAAPGMDGTSDGTPGGMLRKLDSRWPLFCVPGHLRGQDADLGRGGEGRAARKHPPRAGPVDLRPLELLLPCSEH